jgi:hypothetical protein
MINGAHALIYSRKPEADRDFLRDVLRLPHVDAGGGWLIFGLPPAEVAIHPHDRNNLHALYLMCADVEAFVAEMQARRLRCGPITDEGWGRLTELRLPGGGKIGVYEPRHPRPEPTPPARRRTARRSITARTRSRR